MNKLNIGILVTLVLFFLSACTQKDTAVTNAKSKLPKGDYFGLTVGTTAEMFAKGIVSREFQELNAVFSPDGNEFYYTIADPFRNFYTIVFYKRNKNDEWEGPEVAPFSGSYADADPSFSSDGKRLFFISKRPLNDSTITSKKDFDIWAVDRTSTGWGTPINLDFLNTTTNEFYVSTTDAGSIFFSAQYKDGLGRGDIYEARRGDDGMMNIENLGGAINSPTGEGDPYVSPDGKMIIFMSWGREDDLGGGDLYISFKKDGKWSKAKNLGSKINSNQFEYCPMMSPDGKYFFWTSYRTSNYNSASPRDYKALEGRLNGTDNGLGNVYWIDAKVLEEFRN